jgi:nicotinamidase-related amidase
MATSVPSGTVAIPEIEVKEAVNLKADETAVVVVDMQNDFVKPNGNLVVEDAVETIPNIQYLLKSAREADVRIAYTQDTAVEGDPEFDIWPEHCLLGTWGREFVEELMPESDDLICEKNRYDGFYGTWLDHFLTRIWEVKNVVIVGTVANICVLHTAASAGLRWLNVVMPADGISALNPFDQAMTLRQVSWLYAGQVVRSTKDITFER